MCRSKYYFFRDHLHFTFTFWRHLQPYCNDMVCYAAVNARDMTRMTFSRCTTLNSEQPAFIAIYSCGISLCTCLYPIAIETTFGAAVIGPAVPQPRHSNRLIIVRKINWRNESIDGAFVQYFNLMF